MLTQLESLIPEGATPFIVRATSGANAEATAAKAAEPGKTHHVLGYLVCLRAAAAGSSADVPIQLKDGTTEKMYDIIGASAVRGTRISLASNVPILVGTTGNSINLIVGAAGTGAITELTMWGYTI